MVSNGMEQGRKRARQAENDAVEKNKKHCSMQMTLLRRNGNEEKNYTAGWTRNRYNTIGGNHHTDRRGMEKRPSTLMLNPKDPEPKIRKRATLLYGTTL